MFIPFLLAGKAEFCSPSEAVSSSCCVGCIAGRALRDLLWTSPEVGLKLLAAEGARLEMELPEG